MSLLEALVRRRSAKSVTDAAPSREELLPLVAAAATVADHAALRPWRLIEVRGEARRALGAAIAAASGLTGPAAERLAEKPMRAPLLLAIVAVRRPHPKVPAWEQEATAAGMAHILSLLLDDAGWGVMWRTGRWARSQPVRRVHGLADHEDLLGWLYVGGKTGQEPAPRPPVDAAALLTSLPVEAQ